MLDLLWQVIWALGGLAAAILLPMLLSWALVSILGALKRTPIFAA